MDILFILFLIITGVCLASALKEERLAVTLPMVCMSVTTVLYFVGLLGLPLVIGCLLWTAGAVFLIVYRLVIRREGRQIVRTYGKDALILAVFFALLLIPNYGKLGQWVDEFSHWLDIVKAMTMTDRFSTDPSLNLMFRTYPPGMALFQYYHQKFAGFFFRKDCFTEWRCYQAWQMYLFGILLPLLPDVKRKEWGKSILSLLILLLVPTTFFYNTYSLVTIDPFVAVLAGAGLTMVAVYEKKDAVTYPLFMSLLCFTLVLAKDVGAFFSLAVAIAFLVERSALFKGSRKILSAVPLLLCLLARFTWKLALTRGDTGGDSPAGMSFLEYTSLFFRHTGTQTQLEILSNFKHALFEWSVELGDMGIDIPWIIAAVVLFAGVVMVLLEVRKAEGAKSPLMRSARISAVVMLILIPAYIYGLGYIYVAQFSEYEALNLASYPRYIGMVYETAWILLLFGGWRVLCRRQQLHGALYVLILTVVLLSSNTKYFVQFLTRENVRHSIYERKEYTELTEKVLSATVVSDRVYFISQGDNGADSLVMRFVLRPIALGSDCGYSLGQPMYDGDIWTQEASADSLRDALMKNYDYLAIHQLDESFAENYGVLFEDPGSIVEESLYRVDKDSGLLKKVA